MNGERKHSILARNSKEWVHCGFSAKFLANKEEETNNALEFGTECHVLAEAFVKQSLRIEDFDEKPVSIDELESTFMHYGEGWKHLPLAMRTSSSGRLIMKRSERERGRWYALVKKHPLCEHCLEERRRTPVEEVHHILLVNRDGTDAESNLMSLCRSCHNKIHIELGDRHPRE